MNKSIPLLMICLILIFSLASCGKKDDSNTYDLYFYENDDRDTIIAKPTFVSPDTPESMIQNIYSLLSSTSDDKLIPIITRDVKLLDITLENTTCTLTLSPRYLDIPSVNRIAMNVCLTKTICSLPFADSIVIVCEDFTEKFSPNDFVLTSPNTDYDIRTVNLYFANDELNSLECETQFITLRSNDNLELTVMSRLLSGPTQIGKQRTLPAELTINTVYVRNGICYVDLSSEFVENVIHDKKSEYLALYSIVNTLTELPMINSVKILINGVPSYDFAHFDISQPLTNKTIIFE